MYKCAAEQWIILYVHHSVEYDCYGILNGDVTWIFNDINKIGY